MKPIISIFLFCIISTVSAQDLKLPDKPYVIVIGRDSFVTQTIIEEIHYESGRLVSGLKIPGIKLVLDMPIDTSKQEPVFQDRDSLRLMTYLFKDENYRINFPQRIDTLNVYDMLSDSVYIEIDTTDHVDINRLVKTITTKELKKLIKTEIEIYQGDTKLKLDRISVLLVWPEGIIYGTNYEKSKIGDYKSVNKLIKKLPKKSFIAIDCIWFYDKTGDRKEIEGSIGWKLK